MANTQPLDPFVSTEAEIDVDAKTATAIRLGIRCADENRGLASDKVRKLRPQWISKFSTPIKR